MDRFEKFQEMIMSIGFLILICLTSVVKGEFYKYRDNTGKTVFVDDIGKVPEMYRDQIRVYKEKYDDISDEARRLLIEKENQKQLTDIQIKENKILVPVWLGANGKKTEVLLLLDTGASIVTLYEDAAQKLDLNILKEAKARVAGGKEVPFNVASVDYIKIGPYEKNDMLVGILALEGHEMGYDGLLGMNFLQYFSYDIDFEEQKIKWTPKTN